MKHKSRYLTKKPSWRKNSISRKQKRIIYAGIVIIVFFLGMAGMLLERNKWKTRYSDLQGDYDRLEKTIFVLNKEVRAGEILMGDMISQKECLFDEEGIFAAEGDILGKVLRVDGYEGMPLVFGVLKDRDAENVMLRSVLCREINIAELQQEKDMIDLRVRLYDGQDEVVLERKVIQWISDDRQGLQLNLTEEEIRCFAQVQKKLRDQEGYLYTVTYVR